MERLLRLARGLPPYPALVTGASGRIGRRLVEVLLAAGVSVHAMSRRGDIDVPVGMRLYVADLARDQGVEAAVGGVATVFHLASHAPRAADLHPENNPQHQTVTVTGTWNLLNLVSAADVDSLVFASSTRVLDGSKTLYAQCKAEAERLVLAKSGSMKTTVLRLPPVYGFAREGSIAQMLAAVDAGRMPPLPDFGDKRSLVHVDDVVQGLLLAALSPASGGKAYTVTDLQQYSTRQIYELICRALGREPSSRAVPPWLLGLGAGAGSLLEVVTGRKMPLNREKLNSLRRSAYFDAQDMVRDLAFSPLYTLEQALPEIVRQYTRA
ncbi:NAD-dependent epimerase/dehydratase family protein [Thiolapillus sp.]